MIRGQAPSGRPFFLCSFRAVYGQQAGGHSAVLRTRQGEVLTIVCYWQELPALSHGAPEPHKRRHSRPRTTINEALAGSPRNPPKATPAHSADIYPQMILTKVPVLGLFSFYVVRSNLAGRHDPGRYYERRYYVHSNCIRGITPRTAGGMAIPPAKCTEKHTAQIIALHPQNVGVNSYRPRKWPM